MALNYRVTKDVSQWVELFKNNTIYVSPHDIKRGIFCTIMPNGPFLQIRWANKYSRSNFSSSDIEYHYLVINLFSSDGGLAGIATDEFDEFR